MRIRDIKLTINAVDYKCRARSANLEPLENVVLCTDNLDYELTVELELTYGVGGTYNTISALAGTVVEHVVAPADDVAAATNPTWTFDAVVPPIPKMIGSPGEIGVFTYVVQTEGGLVEALV